MMKRQASIASLLVGALVMTAAPVWARSKSHQSKSDDQTKETKDEKSDNKPTQVAKFKNWTVFVTHGKMKTCYALEKPVSRAPASLKRDDAYIFISTRPAEKVRNEVSVIMGFTLKATTDPKAEISGSSFDLVAKGANAWVKDPSQESAFIEAMKKGSKLTVKALSTKGNASVDTYITSGLGEALAQVHKECP